MIARSLVEAYRDRRLARRDLVVWADAIECLCFTEPRPFKLLAVARATGIHVGHVAASVRRLTVAGYLLRGPKLGQLRTYTLASNPSPPRRAV